MRIGSFVTFVSVLFVATEVACAQPRARAAKPPAETPQNVSVSTSVDGDGVVTFRVAPLNGASVLDFHVKLPPGKAPDGTPNPPPDPEDSTRPLPGWQGSSETGSGPKGYTWRATGVPATPLPPGGATFSITPSGDARPLVEPAATWIGTTDGRTGIPRPRPDGNWPKQVCGYGSVVDAQGRPIRLPIRSLSYRSPNEDEPPAYTVAVGGEVTIAVTSNAPTCMFQVYARLREADESLLGVDNMGLDMSALVNEDFGLSITPGAAPLDYEGAGTFRVSVDPSSTAAGQTVYVVVAAYPSGLGPGTAEPMIYTEVAPLRIE